MFWRMLKTVLILPGSALIYIPLLIQWATGGWPFGAPLGSGLQISLALVLAIPAFALAGWTMRLFTGEGDGTPAPWDPPRNFVVSGPYRHVRNPMLSSVIILIVAEALATNSLPLLIWAMVFFVLNTLYFAFSEEPGLEERFGQRYRTYKTNVPRWVPRLSPFEPLK